MAATFKPLALDHVHLAPSLFRQRFDINRAYLMSLRNENLLQNFYQEATLWNPRAQLHDCHWGWETPTCQLRGHFLGHWLSAAARVFANTGDAELKGKADAIVGELGRCQDINGGGWIGSIPEKYLDWIARGQRVWAPHYTLHKTLMGLYEMFHFAGNEQALDIMKAFAGWFHRWTGQFSREQLDDILDVETGGMLEAWADLYGVTGEDQHLELIQRYDRRRLFDPLLAGEDVLTNRHANTTIPEAQGVARAYEVTGDERWREIVEAYWRSAVTERGYYCTGGQTDGEIWTPHYELAARLGDKNQEHCTVYNMMRLADYLLRWTGDVAYADYRERNLYNGILAQQHPDTGMVAYFLPLEPGAKKKWSTPTGSFWCCSGTLVQANASHAWGVYYEHEGGLTVCQYVPTDATWLCGGTRVDISMRTDPQTASTHRPMADLHRINVRCDSGAAFGLSLRLPWWLGGAATITVNGKPEPVSSGLSRFHCIERTWRDDVVEITLPRELTTCPLPDASELVAFMEGPVVLAGLCDETRLLEGDPDDPTTLLMPQHEREWDRWVGHYHTRDQSRGLRFIPLHEVRDEQYAVYFPVRRR